MDILLGKRKEEHTAGREERYFYENQLEASVVVVEGEDFSGKKKNFNFG